MEVKLSNGRCIPIEMHKVRIVQKTTLPPIDQRLQAIEEAGYNTFLLRTRDVFIDMLTDSGTNAMSDNQLAAMMVSDDAYAGGESYYKLLRRRQGRARVRVLRAGPPGPRGRAPAGQDLRQAGRRRADELPLHHHQGPLRDGRRQGAGDLQRRRPEDRRARNPFKGNLDLDKFQAVIKQVRRREDLLRPHGSHDEPDRRPAVLAGQPARRSGRSPAKHGIPVVIDCSLISENAYFIKRRENGLRRLDRSPTSSAR